MSHIGIVEASHCISEARLRRCLPPEHSIVGTQRWAEWTEYLVSGPLIPTGNPSAPEHVCITFTMEQANGDGMRLTGDINGSVWIIGEWPSFEAYGAEMAALDDAGEGL